MTKTATRPGPVPKPVAAEKRSDKDKDKEKEKPKETLRDFVEQIVVAILLALLIRGFDAEAFVIPTGSMAPTLMGRHKEITCPQCGNVYAVNSSEEIEGNPNIPQRIRDTEAAVCVNCRFPARIGDEPSFKGDRILVMKFPYELPWLPGAGGPRRWDVVVFHYPEKPEQNYIKRLVGLPLEDLKVYRGDIFVRPTGDGPFQIARKPSSRLLAMAVLVNDDTHRAKLLANNPEWLRWKGSEGWKEEGDKSVFTFSSAAGSLPGNLRYRHLVPDPEQWQALWDKSPLPRAPRATLITDFSSYNASTLSDQNDLQAAWLQSHWVGDLLLEFDLDIQKVDGGVFNIELVSAGIKNRCVIDPKTGMASLYHGDTKLGETKTSITGTGRHSIGFANVDDRLTLWVDGRTPFGDGLSYEDSPGTSYAPTAADLDPVGLSASGMSVKVSGLVLKRDIYYTRDPRESDFAIPAPPPMFEQPGQKRSTFARVVGLFDVLADPSRFSTWMAEPEPGDVYSIRDNHFMMMGDNSPRSFDGRAWGRGDREWDKDRERWEVPRALLIGKAFFVYWPHGVPFLFDIRVSHDFRIPFRPYIERMKPIR